MDIEVESQFNGKKLARLTNLIKNLIRKSVKRKHTLPRYKVRYKPFFRQPVVYDGKKEVFLHNSLVTVGKLEVEVMDCSRLTSLPPNSLLYCIVSVDSLPWREDMPLNSSLWPVHEVSIFVTFAIVADVFLFGSYIQLLGAILKCLPKVFLFVFVAT